MKKSKKILLSIFLIVIAGIAMLGWWQRDNILAVYKTVFITDDQLTNEIDKNKSTR